MKKIRKSVDLYPICVTIYTVERQTLVGDTKMAIHFKWNKEDKNTGRIMADYGYHGNRKEIGSLTRKSGKVNAYVVVDGEAISTITKRTAGDAKRLATEAYYDYQSEEVEVTYINPHSGKEVTNTISRGALGTASDPSMDAYWTM